MEEAEWAVHVLKATGKPVAATLCIGPEGDLNGVSPGECGVRLVKAGMCSMNKIQVQKNSTSEPQILFDNVYRR